MTSQSSPRAAWHAARRAILAAVLVVPLLILAAGCGKISGQAKEPAIAVTGAWARPASQGDMSAAFFVIENKGNKTVRLTGVRTDAAAAVEIHQTVQDGSTARMQRVEGIEIPAGDQVELAPGGYHVMLMDLQRDLNPGDQIELTLQFEGGHEVAVTAEVRDAGAAGNTHGH